MQLGQGVRQAGRHGPVLQAIPHRQAWGTRGRQVGKVWAGGRQAGRQRC